MQTFNLRGSVVAVVFCAVAAFSGLAVSPVRAADTHKEFASPVEAYRIGVAAYKAQKADRAVAAFGFASDAGILGAQLRLARMYAKGDLVEQDSGRAFEQYKRIVKGFAYLDATHAGAKYVAEAYVAVGRFYEKGIDNHQVKADPVIAARYYRHAASYFGDPVAQFKLARLYLKDNGIRRDIAVAAKWLHSAAKKSHAPSQAVLGELLWAGGPVEKRAVQALALIDLALSNAKGAEREWIADLHKKIFDQAGAADKTKAKTILAQWRSRYQKSAPQQVARATAVDLRAPKKQVAASGGFHPDPVSVIFGAPGGAEAFDADAIFGAATQIDVPDFGGSDARHINVGATSPAAR